MFEIVEFTPFAVKLKNAEGAELTVGRLKQTIKFLELSSKKVGDKVTMNVATATSGRLYSTDNMAFERAMFEAETILKKRQLLDYQIQSAKALAEAGI